MNIALVGFGIENQATLEYLSAKGNIVTIHDFNQELDIPNHTNAVLGPDYLDNLDRYDLIVRTSGMHPQEILDKNPQAKDKLTSAINIFFENCTTPIIGITGTKGKGTTSTLVHKILQASGKKSILVGNIGIPALSMVEQANSVDYVVMELSSFQLYDLKYSPKIATCLMVVPEHLNWHSDFDDYLRAKSNLFLRQQPDDTAVYNIDNEFSRKIASVSQANNKLSYGAKEQKSTVYIRGDDIVFENQVICQASEVKLLGRHNLENICAAIAVTWPIVSNKQAIRSVVSSFSGLPYRLEFVREVNNVKYYNDSFSTTPETAIAAIKAFATPKIVILGGSYKGVEFDKLADEVIKNNVKHVLAIGETGPNIANLLQKRGFNDISLDGLDTMESIVAKAQSLSNSGDTVLLSTGCASFDMFKDYKDRGDLFNQAVQSLTST